MSDGKCECNEGDKGVTFMGPHCEVRLKDDCRTIYSGESIFEVLTCGICIRSSPFRRTEYYCVFLSFCVQ